MIGITETTHPNSPRPVPLRRYAEFGDAAIELVRRAINQTQAVDDANDEIQHFKTVTSLDVPEPTRWQCFLDAVEVTIDGAARATSDDQRRKLGAVALIYLDRLLGEIKAEEAAREKARGFFVAASELVGASGIDYLTNVFDEALAHGQFVNFEKE